MAAGFAIGTTGVCGWPDGRPGPGSIQDRIFQADGKWYRRIATEGYSYEPDRRSDVAFFPLFPILGRSVAVATGMSPEVSLLIVSNGCFALCFGVLSALAAGRAPSLSGYCRCVFLALGLAPLTFFFRLPYSESLFLVLAGIAFVGIRRGWPPVGIALAIGLATATRPVGIALIPPFLLHVWRTGGSTKAFARTAFALLPLCLWGLTAYVGFLWDKFDEPVAFARTQENWRLVPRVATADKLLSLVSLEPFWGYVDPESPFHWRRHQPPGSGALTAGLMDRGAVTAWAVLTALGWYRRWLTPEESLFSVCVVGMAYVLRGYEMAFFSMGRFTLVAFPVYLVAGRLLAAIPRWVGAGLLFVCGFLLAAYSARFAAGYLLI